MTEKVVNSGADLVFLEFVNDAYLTMKPEFDRIYGGHEVCNASLVDEAIETVAKVIAGTDARCERTGIMGGPVLYAAEKVKDGYERVDGKHFNMSYIPSKVLSGGETRQVIRAE